MPVRAVLARPPPLPPPRYHLCQHVPYWQGQDEVSAWMHAQRTNDSLQAELPLLPGALEGVKALQQLVPVVAYITVRPQVGGCMWGLHPNVASGERGGGGARS